jgi:hypothetical protein
VRVRLRRPLRPAGLQASLGNQALILQDTGDLDCAMRLLEEKQAICRQLNHPNGLAVSLANQAHLLAFNLSRPAAAPPLAEEAARLAAKHGLIALANKIEQIGQAIRRRRPARPPSAREPATPCAAEKSIVTIGISLPKSVPRPPHHRRHASYQSPLSLREQPSLAERVVDHPQKSRLPHFVTFVSFCSILVCTIQKMPRT